KDFGGLGCGLHGNILTAVMAVEEIARGCSSTAQVFHNHNGCIGILYYLGSPEQQRRFSHETVADGAMHVIWGGETGKNVYDIRTTARRVDGGYLVDGTKIFSTGSGGATWFQLAAVVEGKSLPEGMIIPLVRRDNLGVSIADDWDAMGQRGTASGTTVFKDCFVPDADVLGEPGDYYKLLLFGPYFQLGWAALFVGLARGALDTAVNHVRTHTRPWADAGFERATQDPYIRGHIADMSVRVEAARQLIQVAARALEQAHDEPAYRPEAAIAVYRAKVLATEASLEVTSRIFQVMGARAAGKRSNDFDRYWRNARTFTLHDPVDWKRHLIGTWMLEGTPPPVGWY
ncbi:MAG: acyl-CoA dehydrogenase family protein, partial [Gammaproteobacteria bacterium]